jgi:hypothetical protein
LLDWVFSLRAVFIFYARDLLKYKVTKRQYIEANILGFNYIPFSRAIPSPILEMSSEANGDDIRQFFQYSDG